MIFLAVKSLFNNSKTRGSILIILAKIQSSSKTQVSKKKIKLCLLVLVPSVDNSTKELVLCRLGPTLLLLTQFFNEESHICTLFEENNNIIIILSLARQSVL